MKRGENAAGMYTASSTALHSLMMGTCLQRHYFMVQLVLTYMIASTVFKWALCLIAKPFIYLLLKEKYFCDVTSAVGGHGLTVMSSCSLCISEYQQLFSQTTKITNVLYDLTVEKPLTISSRLWSARHLSHYNSCFFEAAAHYSLDFGIAVKICDRSTRMLSGLSSQYDFL